MPPIWLMRQAGPLSPSVPGAAPAAQLRGSVPRRRSSRPKWRWARFATSISTRRFCSAICCSRSRRSAWRCRYDDGPPKLDGPLTRERIAALPPLAEAAAAPRVSRPTAWPRRARVLPADKGLIGFVGGPWTLFVYAMEGSHAGPMRLAKSSWALYREFAGAAGAAARSRASRMQLAAGADVVMVLDTAAGDLPPCLLSSRRRAGSRARSRAAFPAARLLREGLAPGASARRRWRDAPWAGFGFDSRWDLARAAGRAAAHGLRAGQLRSGAGCSCPTRTSTRRFDEFLAPIARADGRARRGWICGLGHGVLPGTPEVSGAHVRRRVREAVRMSHVSCLVARKYDVPVPRYTSYPAVPHWQDTPTPEHGSASLDRRARRADSASLAVYVHLPFCEIALHVLRLQHGDHARPRAQRPVRRSRARASSTCISRACRRSPTRPVSQMHLGGGTPTFLPPAALASLLTGLAARLPARADGSKDRSKSIRA